MLTWAEQSFDREVSLTLSRLDKSVPEGTKLRIGDSFNKVLS